MQVGKYELHHERCYRLYRQGLFVYDFEVSDPDGRINYAEVHYKAKPGEGYRKWWNAIGWRPSPSHHLSLRGLFDTPEEAMEALVCELRMRSHERGTLEYAEAYRDRWLRGIEIVTEVPEGWKIREGAMTQPCGTKWIGNCKSFFSGEYEHKLLYVGR